LPRDTGKGNLSATRYQLLWLVAAIYWVISGATRAVLAGKSLAAGQIGPGDLPGVLGIGAGLDLIVALGIGAPLALYLLLVPERLYRASAHRVAIRLLLALTFFGMTYLAAVEYFFFDEFNARFNYVAVEYLIYPHEVFVNIWESYPVGRVIACAAALSGALLWTFRTAVRTSLAATSRLRERIAPAAFALLLPVAGIWLLPGSGLEHNRVAAELAANGIRSFLGSAYTSHLDYNQYYYTLDEREAAERVRRLVAQPNPTFLRATPTRSRGTLRTREQPGRSTSSFCCRNRSGPSSSASRETSVASPRISIAWPAKALSSHAPTPPAPER